MGTNVMQPVHDYRTVGGRLVFPLGFGTAWLQRGAQSSESERMIQSAIDAGVTYIDTARMYVGGTAEAMLGNVIKTLPAATRNKLVVASKLGILPPSLSILARTARKLLGNIAPAFAQAQRHAFAPKQIRDSLETSLRVLGVERLDVLLLHGSAPDDLTDEALATLDLLHAAGKFDLLGTASGRADTLQMLERPDKARWQVVQVPANAWETPIHELPQTGATWVSHSLFGPRFLELSTKLANNLSHKARWSELLGVECNQKNLATAMVRLALAENPGGIVLFSTKRTSNLTANIAAAEAGPLPESEAKAMRRLAAATV